MKKLRLNLDDVKIESFETDPDQESGRGTVRGQQECPNEGMLPAIEECGGDFGEACTCCRCCRCTCCRCCCTCHCCCGHEGGGEATYLC